MIKTFDMTPLKGANKKGAAASTFLHRKMRGTPSNLFNMTLENVLQSREGRDDDLSVDVKSR